MATYITDVTASDDFIELLLETLGYPIIEDEVLYNIFPKDFIKEKIIGLSMELFYTYFPIIKEFSMSSNTTIDSTIDNVLGIVHYTFVNGNISNTEMYNQGPWSLSNKVSLMSMGNTYGTPFNYNSYTYSTYQQKFYSDSMKNLNGGRKHSVIYDEKNNKFISQSKMNGTFNVEVGCYSNNVSDIPKHLLPKFTDLCRAEIGMKFARSVNLIDADLPLAINSDDLLEDSKDLKEETVEWFERNSKFTVMK